MSETRILVLRANPTDTEPLEQNREVGAIKEGIDRSGGTARFKVLEETEVAPGRLTDFLVMARPHVVHFSGHGGFGRFLFLLGKDGLSAPVAAETVAAEFRALAAAGSRVRCVVLNACYSDGVAEALVEHVDCVVGMTSAIADESAIAFASGFYFAVSAGLFAQSAVEAGCNQIRLTSARQGDWDLPRLRTEYINPGKYDISSGKQTPPWQRGELLHGKYALCESLGEGPIAQTDVMEDVQLRRRVVVKTLIKPAARRAFLDEAADLVRVSKHPNIIAIYGSWLHDDPPHYVREYAEGRTLRDWLDNGGPADRSIDFVQQVLTALAEAMGFAMQVNVPNLGIVPEKVLIEERNAGSHWGRPTTYQVLVCPGPGGSRYRRPARSGGDPDRRELYVDPEYESQNPQNDTGHQYANQYRLGVIGYELLVGSDVFREEARRRDRPPARRWRSFKEAAPDRHCPSFLCNAIEKMIDPEPDNRHKSFAEAVAAIVHPNLHVEVARDSFARILDKDKDAPWEKKFFYQFYTALLPLPGVEGKPIIRDVFDRRGFPPLGAERADRWEQQFNALKEAIVFLFAYHLLRRFETGGLSILSKTAEKHRGFEKLVSAYYDQFGKTLSALAVEYDEGAADRGFLRNAWAEAIKPGLKYLKEQGVPGGSG